MSSAAESVTALESGRLVRREWRAPSADRTAVVVPAWHEGPNVAATNARRLTALTGDLQGKSWTELRAWTRTTILDAAAGYLRDLGFDAQVPTGEGPVIADGHQPELFHPGVWAKNFAIRSLASQTNGVGVHLIVDNDTLSRTAIRVPAGDRDHPRFEWLPFDNPRGTQPWEAVRVADAALFASFGNRVHAAMQPWSVDPILSTVWDQAVTAASHGCPLSDCLTVARIAAEQAWQAGNWELPLSRLCVQPPFLWFAAAMMARADDFARHHNAVLAEYRQLNRVRSRSHPVPELTSVDGWTEAPFWIWRAGETHRSRLFVQQQGQELCLRHRNDIVLRLPLTPGRSADAAVEKLQTLPAQGWRLRTRALTTTLFARLCLADLFVHGLGGAKYDEMTDALIARFFGVTPPTFLTVSATVHLPLDAPPDVSSEDIGRLKHEAWDLAHNPQRHLDEPDNGAATLIAERQQLVQTLLLPSDRRHRAARRQAYRRVREINAELATLLDDRRRELTAELSRLEQRRSANRILNSREYSWALYPADVLRSFYAGLFQQEPRTQ